MLIVECEKYLEEVRAAADKIGKRESLEKELKYLSEYACHVDDSYGNDCIDLDRTHCLLYTDFAPLSFGFVMQLRQEDGSYKNWFNGGLIWFGPGDTGVGLPQLSVRLGDTSKAGWSVHT